MYNEVAQRCFLGTWASFSPMPVPHIPSSPSFRTQVDPRDHTLPTAPVECTPQFRRLSPPWNQEDSRRFALCPHGARYRPDA